VALGASPKITFIINSEFDEYDGRFSPDDRLLAYVSDESGRPEVYVQPFPLTGNKWTISANGGIEPRWRSDGKELFFLALDGGVMSVTVDASDGFRASPARKLFQTRVSGVPNPFQSFLDVTADGQRFLLKTSAPGAASPFFTVVLNWPETLATK
jgi:Tol biopolymer transport system component